jgi:hypothetical protein
MGSLPKNGIGAEIGVAEGCFSEQLIKVCQPRFLYLIDTWKHNPAPEVQSDAANVSQKVQDARFRNVLQRFGHRGVDNTRVLIIRADSVTAARLFDFDFFDWIHIDGDHTRAGEDAEAYWPKMKRGAWMTGHDFTMAPPHITVRDTIKAFAYRHQVQIHVAGSASQDVYERNYPTWVIQKP